MLKVLRISLFSGSNLKQELREGATIHYWSQGTAQFSKAVPVGFCPPVEETARLSHLCHEEYALAPFHHQKSQASSIDLVLEKQVDKHHLYFTGDFISCWTEQIIFPARLASQLPGSHCWNITHSHCSLFISAAQRLKEVMCIAFPIYVVFSCITKIRRLLFPLMTLWISLVMSHIWR